MSKPRVLIVTGPTGVGKTDFVNKLASCFPAQIINADIGQMYEPLTIGTAKPDWKNDPIQNNLFDIITKPQDYSVVQFRSKIKQLVDKIHAQKQTAIIVGGSTLYIKSLFYQPFDFQILDKKSNDINNFAFVNKPANKADLWQELFVIDPVRARQLHPNDSYRLERALQIWKSTQILPSKCDFVYAPLFENMQLFILNAPKEILYRKIDQRVIAMMQAGWVLEVQRLDTIWHEFLRRKKIIGYELILDYLEQKISLDDCINLIQQRVRNYAKRQQTFWRGLKKLLLQQEDMHKNVFELDLTLLDLDLYIKQLLDEINF